MKKFSMSMSKKEKIWYLNLPPKIITSFHEFPENFKIALVKYETKDLVGNSIDALLWVESCKHTILIVKGRQQEHESNPSKFPQEEVKSHEYVTAILDDLCLGKV